MTKMRENQPPNEPKAAANAISMQAEALLGPLLATFSPSEIEVGVVSVGRAQDREGSGWTADDVVDRLNDALVEASLARMLRTARTRAGLTLAELAERLLVSRGRVHQLERDGANLELSTVGRMAAALGYEARIVFVPREPKRQSVLIAPFPTIDDGRSAPDPCPNTESA